MKKEGTDDSIDTQPLHVINAPKPMNQAQPTPNQNRATFWTVCPYCRVKYEYYKELVNISLLCKPCDKLFMAFEANGSTNYSGTSSKASQTPKPMNQQAQAQQQHKVQTQPTPNQNRATFWTVCPYCRVKYEYYKELVNTSLLCKTCSKRFMAFEANGPTNYSGISSKASQKTESVMKKGQPSTVPQSTFNKRSPKPTEVGTKIFEIDKPGASIDTMFTSQANKKKDNSTRRKRRYRTTVNNMKKKKMKSGSAGSSSDSCCNETESSIDSEEEEEDSVEELFGVGGNCVVPYPDFHDFDSERSMDKFKAGQIWAFYSDEDTLPKYYGLITKINAPLNSGLQVQWLSCMKFEDIIPWVDKDIPVTCGRFKVSRKTSQKYDDPGPFSHEVKAQLTKDKDVYHIIPRKGDVWALYKGWNKNMPCEELQICEYEIVEVLETDYMSSITVLILEHVKGYKSVFKPQKKGESVEWTMQIPWSEMLRFSHHIPAVRLSEEKGGTLRGFWELDTAALPPHYFL